MNGSTQHVLRNQSLSISVGPTLIGIDWLVIYMVCKAKIFTVAAEAIALAHTLKLLHELDRESKVVNNVFSEKFGVSGPLETWIYVGWAAWNDWVHLFFSVFSSTWTWGDNDWMYILGGGGVIFSSKQGLFQSSDWSAPGLLFPTQNVTFWPPIRLW